MGCDLLLFTDILPCSRHIVKSYRQGVGAANASLCLRLLFGFVFGGGADGFPKAPAEPEDDQDVVATERPDAVEQG